MKRVLAVGVCVLLAAVTPSLAGIDKGNGEIGFDFGATSFDSDLSGKGGGRLAFRGGWHLTRLFQIEAEASVSAHYPIHQQGTTRADIVLTTFFVNGVFNFHSKSGNVVPYLLAGVGTSNLDFPPAHLSDSGAAHQFAAGSRFFFGERDHVAFRIEASRITADSFSTTFNHMNYVVGFTWRIGGGS
ncbi:MAG TPA: outer membrane beta-barrel protein [Candidatus Polarisedimenticolia bacterium]|nr:outer membrane beta-barrel protein [Candidatus Polarisedimenticolia bacterium]